MAAQAFIGRPAAAGVGLGIEAQTPGCQVWGLISLVRHCNHPTTTPPPGRFVCPPGYQLANVPLPNASILYRRPSPRHTV